jgi:hypothetical protein
MSEAVAKQSTEHTDAFKNPSLSWMIGFLFVVSFLGLFSVVPLRKVHFPTYITIQLCHMIIGNLKLSSAFYVLLNLLILPKTNILCYLGCFQVMIVDFKLTYPSGTATAHLINSFHTPAGAKLAK